MSMQNQTSNLVYVVSLGSGTPEWSKLSWIDIVEKKRRYFHPFGGGGWPTEPPNYLGFRYYGKLQSIYHVESYEIVTEYHRHIPEIDSGIPDDGNLHILYRLGKTVHPSHQIRTGNIYPSGRVWAMFDTLLTCKTISEARDLTKKRMSEVS